MILLPRLGMILPFQVRFDFLAWFVHFAGVNIVQITPGAGGMYCGNCFRDNALVEALRQLGHSTLMVPLYLPMTLDESDQSRGTPIFFGGINVYLDQKLTFYRHLPGWLRHWLDAPGLLKWAAGRAAKTRAADVGELLISMLRGEEGRQQRELGELCDWLEAQPERPDVVCLSNALLCGLARSIKKRLGAAVVCMLQGEDPYIEALPAHFRGLAWQTLAERAADCDLFIAPSHYYADLMARRLAVPAHKMRVIWNGISLEGYAPRPTSPPSGPVVGYFARMCRDKGLPLLVEAFIEVKKRGRVPGVKLRVGGGCGPSDEPVVEEMRQQLRQARCLDAVEFHPNVDRSKKIEFLQSLSVLSVPALYGEAFGLYIIEALAAGVPVVQPRHAAFPELIEATQGGVVCEPTVLGLAEALETLLLDPIRLRLYGESGRQKVRELFTAGRMADAIARACGEVAHRP